MAILIPSKNIYDKQNPKVRDNVIERIEVGAVEVVEIKNNNANVYNGSFQDIDTFVENNSNNFYWEAPTTIYNSFVVSTLAYVEYNNHTYTNIEIKIPLLQQKAWVKELNLGNNSNIQYNIGGYIHKGTVSSNKWSGIIQKAGSKAFISSLTKLSLSYKQTEEGNYSTYQIPKESTSSFIKYDVVSGSATAKVNVVDGGNLITVKPDIITENGVEYYKLSLKILVGCRIVKITSYNSVPESYSILAFPISNEDFNIGEATYEEYIPDEINLTVYGQTIGIDLTDKTVYINGQTAKKVHSVDGNELMQTSNYSNIEQPFDISQLEIKYHSILFRYYAIISFKDNLPRAFLIEIKAKNKTTGAIIDTYINSGSLTSATISINENDELEIISATQMDSYSIEGTYLNTQNLYKYGKETATIRCSINDYYDYENNAKKIIAIDNSTKKMSFSIGDQVIPMVYGADRKDRPMSINKDGSPKIFQVLGTKVYYDGAVWQELSLQEI